MTPLRGYPAGSRKRVEPGQIFAASFEHSLPSSGVSFTIELMHVVSGYRLGNILRETALKPAPLRGPVESSKNLILSTMNMLMSSEKGQNATINKGLWPFSCSVLCSVALLQSGGNWGQDMGQLPFLTSCLPQCPQRSEG